ncbi:D-glucuronyl C5-epimerase family protein [Actinokineospora guangxiensis]|uniref:D-glucuronyl C5-epimerase family protein n=1 Tax=Actinokineospora guangxiensis TaxID=1490288 RepID=A0ABW0EEJ9_9PSEU
MRAAALAVVVLVSGAAPQVTAAQAAPARVEPVEIAEVGLLGTPQVPADRVRVGRALAAQNGPAAREEVSGYSRLDSEVFAPAVGQRPYESAAVTPVEGYGVVDAAGVRMFAVSGTNFNHPVGQAQYALANLNSHRLTGNPAYLRIAVTNAERLLERRVESADAWYFPYEFDFALYGNRNMMMRAPWYSAMAQGQVLSTFVRLHEVTGDERWRSAAEATFRSLTYLPAGDLPYVTFVDGTRLWLEEYPRGLADLGEQVFNGHNFAVYGLIDYWALTADPTAADLIRGAAATIKDTGLTGFRKPRALSLYALTSTTQNAKYHQIHVEQALHLWGFTRDPVFLAVASAFRDDYPLPTVGGTMRATRRTSTIYQVDSAMRVVRSKEVSFSRDTQAPADRRQRVTGGPVAFRVTAGSYKNWWFPEGVGTTWLLGAKDVHEYRPQARVQIAAGGYSAYRLDAAGGVAGAKTVSFTRATSAPAVRSGIVQGRQAYYFAVGAFAGHWLPAGPRLALSGP